MNIDKPAEIKSILNRRSFLQRAGLGAAAFIPGASLIMASGNASAQTASYDATLDLEILNFALNLEYLESNFYLYATTGGGLAANGVGVTGKGTQGTVTVKGSSTVVPFSSTVVSNYADELARDETHHVEYLRTALGSNAVAQPPIDLVNSFNTLAAAANALAGSAVLPTPFDPFANDLNFLLGGFIFEDVGVTAYRGAAPLITNKLYLASAAGILGTEAYHASNIRTTLYAMDAADPGAGIAAKVQAISNLRAHLSQADDDQGITATIDNAPAANIVPTGVEGLVFPRTGRQVLNVVFGAIGVTKGLFFPDGVNEVFTSASGTADNEG